LIVRGDDIADKMRRVEKLRLDASMVQWDKLKVLYTESRNSCICMDRLQLVIAKLSWPRSSGDTSAWTAASALAAVSSGIWKVMEGHTKHERRLSLRPPQPEKSLDHEMVHATIENNILPKITTFQ
jgi:hypothetical protein